MRFFALICLFSSMANAEKRFNEAYDSYGNRRPAYQTFLDLSGYDALRPPNGVVDRLVHSPLGDKNKIFPIPLILNRKEYEQTIVPGAKQRLKALLKFARDIKQPDPKIYREKIISEILVNAILVDSGLNLSTLRTLLSYFDDEHLGVFYGPDLVRTPDRLWKVEEDNFGTLGGIGENSFMAQAMRETIHKFTKIDIYRRIPDLKSDHLEEILNYFLEKHGIDPQTMLAFIHDCSRQPNQDLESERRSKWLRQNGVTVIPPPDFRVCPLLLEQTRWRAVLNFHQTDTNNEMALISAALKNKQILLRMWPLEFLGHKALLPYVEDFIRFYLGEEPILKTQPTRPFNPSKWTAKTRSDSAIKKGRSSQGRDVFLWGKKSEEEREDFLFKVRQERNVFEKNSLRQIRQDLGDNRRRPIGLWVEQDFALSSILAGPHENNWDGYMINIRPILYSLGIENSQASRYPWGRACPVLGPGINNVCAGSYELVVYHLDCADEIGD